MKKLCSIIFALTAFIVINAFMISADSSNIPVSYSSNDTIIKTISYSSFELQVTNSLDNLTNPLGCRYSNSPTEFSNMSVLGYGGNEQYYTYFSNLADGSVLDYYIKCNSTSGNPDSSAIHLQVTVDLPVTAIVDIPSASDFTNPPTLTSGRFELTLYTSKPVVNTPSLKYSFDGGNTQSPIPLFGSGNIWKGYLLVPGSVGHGAVSLWFSATDLEGVQGTQISSGSVFPVDTQSPSMLADVNAVGNVGSITLNWYPNSPGVPQYNIYRGTSPGLDYTDYYSRSNAVSGSNNLVSYIDSAVQTGQTYYYRIAAVDEAGNVGDLSTEISATVLANSAQATSTTGLSPQLLGYVQNFLTSADAVISNINNIKNSINLKGQTEQKLFSDMGFSDQLDESVAQIQSIERSAQALELQSITQQELSTQLSSLNVKLGIAQSKIPTDLAILDSASDSYIPDENSVTSALLLYNSSFTQSEISDNVKNTLSYIKSSGMQIENSYYIARVVYLDGTMSTLSVVSRQIKGSIEDNNNAYFVENVPKYVASRSSDITIVRGSANILQQDPALGFGSGTKVILYYVSGNKSISNLKNTDISFIMTSKGSSSAPITGNFLVNVSDISGYWGIGLGIVVVIILLIYFLLLKKNKPSALGIEVLDLLEKIDSGIKEKNDAAVQNFYSRLQEKYKLLLPEEKKLFYNKILHIQEKISKLRGEKKNAEIKK